MTKGLVTISSESIVTISADVIVNSANPWLGGIGPELPDGVGGVDGVIHRAAGRKLWEACQLLPTFLGYTDGFVEMMRCGHGDLRVTESFGLPGKKIFHAVAPLYADGKSAELETLKSLYERIFSTVAGLQFRSVALPPLGTRSFGMPRLESAQIAVERAAHHANKHGLHVCFSVVDAQERAIYESELARCIVL